MGCQDKQAQGPVSPTAESKTLVDEMEPQSAFIAIYVVVLRSSKLEANTQLGNHPCETQAKTNYSKNVDKLDANTQNQKAVTTR